MVARGDARFVGDFELWRGAPEAFEVVIPAGLLAENVQDEAAEIDQRPFRGAATFAVFWGAVKMSFQLVFDLAADGLHLWRAEASADHEVVGESSDATEIENGYSCSFLVLRRFDRQADALWQRV